MEIVFFAISLFARQSVQAWKIDWLFVVLQFKLTFWTIITSWVDKLFFEKINFKFCLLLRRTQSLDIYLMWLKGVWFPGECWFFEGLLLGKSLFVFMRNCERFFCGYLEFKVNESVVIWGFSILNRISIKFQIWQFNGYCSEDAYTLLHLRRAISELLKFLLKVIYAILGMKVAQSR